MIYHSYINFLQCVYVVLTSIFFVFLVLTEGKILVQDLVKLASEIDEAEEEETTEEEKAQK